MEDTEQVLASWTDISLVIIPGNQFDIIIYFYGFYKMRISETWQIQEIVDKLAQHTGVPAISIILFQDGTTLTDYFVGRNDKSMHNDGYVNAFNLAEGSKIRALRTLKWDTNHGRALIMSKDDTISILKSRIQKKKGARVRELH